MASKKFIEKKKALHNLGNMMKKQEHNKLENHKETDLTLHIYHNFQMVHLEAHKLTQYHIQLLFHHQDLMFQ